VGGQTRAGAPAVAAAVGERVVGWSESVFDGITSNICTSRLEKEKTIRKDDPRRLGVSPVRQMTIARRYQVFPEGGLSPAHAGQGWLVG
jgi:hypothetical protein